MKTTLTRCYAAVIFTFAAFTSFSQTTWEITGNSNIANSNFLGTTNNKPVIIRTNNKERLRILSNGNVGIGTKTPASNFDVAGTISGFDSYFGKTYPISVGTSGASYSSVGYGLTFTDTTANYRYHINNDYSSMLSFRSGGFDFNTAPIGTAGNIITYKTVMTILQSGRVGIGTSTPMSTLTVGGSNGIALFTVSGETSSFSPIVSFENITSASDQRHGLSIKAGNNTVVSSKFIEFLRPDATSIGKIYQNTTSSVTYSTTSDKRLKNIIGTTQKGLSDLMKIKIYDYTFKSDRNKQVLSGFMAQELYDIFPQSVSKPRENNEPAEKNPWMVDYGSVTPLIIKAMQELNENQNSKFKSQDEEIAKLKKEIAELKALLISQHKENSIDTTQTASNQ